jgi:hypothetical protein
MGACGARTGLGATIVLVDAGEHDSGIASSDAGAPEGAPEGGVTSDAATCGVETPLAYYPLDKDTLDYSGNASNAQAHTIVAVPGKIGGAYHFNGADSWLRAGFGPVLAGARTLCGWIRPSPRSGLGQPFFSGGTTNAADFMSISPTSPSGGTCKALQANVPFLDHWGNADCERPSLTVTPGAWNLLCYLYDGASTITFFVNGSQASVPGALYDYDLATVMMGSTQIAGTTTDSSLDGDLDELSIWSSMLGTGQLGQLWNNGAGCTMQGLWSGG